MVHIVKGGGRAPPTLTSLSWFLPTWWNVRQKVAIVYSVLDSHTHNWKHGSVLCQYYASQLLLKYRFISQLEYSWVEYIWNVWSRVVSEKGPIDPDWYQCNVHCLYSNFTAYKWHSEHQREGMGDIDYWSRLPCIIWVMIMWRVQVLFIALAACSCNICKM